MFSQCVRIGTQHGIMQQCSSYKNITLLLTFIGLFYGVCGDTYVFGLVSYFYTEYLFAILLFEKKKYTPSSCEIEDLVENSFLQAVCDTPIARFAGCVSSRVRFLGRRIPLELRTAINSVACPRVIRSCFVLF